jgi:hypothetical protein
MEPIFRQVFAGWLAAPQRGSFSKEVAMGFYENWILPPILDRCAGKGP